METEHDPMKKLLDFSSSVDARIRNAMYCINDLQDAAAILGMKNMSESLDYIRQQISTIPDELTKMTGGVVQQQFQRAQESSSNLLLTALAVAERAADDATKEE